MLCTKERKNEKSCQVIADHFWWHKMHFFCCLPFGCFFSRLVMRIVSYKYLDVCPFETIAPFFRTPYFSIPLPINVAHKGNVTRSLSQCKCSPRAVCTQKHHCTTDRMTWHFYLHVTVSGGCCTTRNAKVHFPLLHLFSIFHAVECFVPRLRRITWMQPLGSTASNDNDKKVRNKEINNRHTLGIKFNRNCHSDFFSVRLRGELN